MSNSKGALPAQHVEYEILHKKAIIIGIVSLIVVLVICYQYFYMILLIEESENSRKEIINELDCSNQFEYFKNHPEMDKNDRDWAFRVIEQECQK